VEIVSGEIFRLVDVDGFVFEINMTPNQRPDFAFRSETGE
jgi:hypothetical protein